MISVFFMSNKLFIYASQTIKSTNELALRTAAAQGDLLKCKTLLCQGINMNAAGSDSKKTALHRAAENGHVEIVEFLLSSGAILTKDKHGKTPFDSAKTHQIKRILGLKFVLRPLNFAPHELELPEFHSIAFDLHQVMRNGSLEDVKKELTPYFNVEIYSIWYYPMMTACIFGDNHSMTNGKIPYMLQKGCDPNKKMHPVYYEDYEGTILHILIANERLQDAKKFTAMVKKFSEIALNPSIQDAENKTIFHMLTLLQATEALIFFLNHFNVSAIEHAINLQDEEGKTPLHHAYLLGNQEIVDLLIQYGASDTITDNQNRQPHDMLTENELEITRSLKKFHINPKRSAAIPLTGNLLDSIQNNRQLMRFIPIISNTNGNF